MYLLCVFVTFFASMWRVKNCSSPDGNYCFDKPCRLSQSEFIIPYSKFMKSFSQPFSAGLRFKMRYESDDATERRYAPKVTMVFFLWDWKSYSDLIQIYDALLTCETILQIHGDHSRNWRCWPHVAWFKVEMFDGRLPFLTRHICLCHQFFFLQDIYAFITSLPFCVTFFVVNLSYMWI